MAAGPKSGHIRADSGVDGIDSISKTLATAQSFCTAVSSFSSENGVQALTELLNLLPQRENEIKARNDTIQDLNAKLDAQERSQKDYTRKQLSSFENRYDEWNDENTKLQGEVEDLEVASKEKDMEITALRKALEDNKARVGDLEAEQTQNTKRLKERDQKLVLLEATLSKTQATADNRTQELRQLHDQMAVLKEAFEDEGKKHENLQDESEKMREQLQCFAQFSVEIKALDLSETIARTEKLWGYAIKLVGNFVGRDLSDEILQSDWTRLRENDVFSHRIPLPQSNSDVAKQMRVAIVLGALARLVDEVVFQPNFLLSEHSGLRELLCQQAAVDPRKEIYIRGILLSVSPEEQDKNKGRDVPFIMDKLLNEVNVQVLLTMETMQAFRKKLERFVTQFQDEWKIVQRGKQKLEPRFIEFTSTYHPWHVFDMQLAVPKEGKYPEAHLSTSSIQDDIVIVPRLYLIETEVETKPITHGYVLRRAHLDAADEEVRKSRSGVSYTRAASSRRRHKSVRGMSVTCDPVPGERKGSHFLSQAPGAPDG